MWPQRRAGTPGGAPLDPLEHHVDTSASTISKTVFVRFRATPDERREMYAKAGGRRGFSKWARRLLLHGAEGDAVRLLAVVQADMATLAKEVLDRTQPIDAVLIISRLSVLYDQVTVSGRSGQ